MASKNIYVYADWLVLNGPSLIGTLGAESIRGNEVFSFEYDNNWLNSDQLFVLDPDMNYYSGPQYLQDDKPNFGVFLDSSPDRWGRVLMRRREALLARMENRPQKNLMQSDYLLGVYDEHRMGALRFKESPDGPFLNDNREMAAPPWTSLRELEYASLQLEKNDSVENPDYLRNHGFLLGKNGWKLSPAFDINPVPTGTGLTLNITDEDNSLDTELALEVAEFFRLDTTKAKETITNIKKSIKNWRKIATQYGLSKREQDLMSAAFEL